MKKYLIFSLLLCFNAFVYSQIKMENGYFINNDGGKVECLIKNLDWLNSPIDFEYQLTPNSPLLKRTIQSTKEFGIADKLVYKRVTVDIDRSSALAGELSIERSPIFKKETLFLKVLIEGKANLYVYNDVNLVRYFYNIGEREIIQLIYKEYVVKDKIKKNNRYKQQLLLNLTCEGLTESDADINYRKSDLVSFFEKYNQCQGSEFINYKKRNPSEGKLNVYIRPGFNSSSLKLEGRFDTPDVINFDNELSLRLGVELEYVFGFNNKKWAIIIEPIYSSYKTNKDITYSTATIPPLADQGIDVEHTSFDLLAGVRHYMFLNEKSKLFINVSAKVVTFSSDSKMDFEKTKDIDLKTDNYFGFGFGYNYKNRFSAEIRLDTPQKLFRFVSSETTNSYNNFSFVLGVNLL